MPCGSRPQESGEKKEEEEVNMDMGQGFIATTQELNVDRGTLPAGVVSSSKDFGDLNPVTG
jgi:hypothetical protein